SPRSTLFPYTTLFRSKECIKHGFELIFHASFADDEALDMLEANKDKHFVAPGIGWLVNTMYNASEFGITEETATKMGYKRELEVDRKSTRLNSSHVKI